VGDDCLGIRHGERFRAVGAEMEICGSGHEALRVLSEVGCRPGRFRVECFIL
jgi:hypothetical protein